MGNGKFIISLDFELHWGSVEKEKLEAKKKYFDTARESIPIVLNLFEKYKIHATWAIVGFLFAKNKEQLISYIPKNKPTYKNDKLSYYKLIENNDIGLNEKQDPYHYAPSLISQIINTPNQEVATHTFSHYYCNEKGQNRNQFDSDLKAAQRIAKENFNIELKSLVFPRNQFNSEYVAIAKNIGIKVVRSNPNVWFWNNNFKLQSIARAVDTLIPISSSLTFKGVTTNKNDVLLLPSSRFLRPYMESEKGIQGMKFMRIKNEMLIAAKNNRNYHLWWHPHNFGYSMKENLIYLEKILSYYEKLNIKYGFTSKSMIEMY